MRGADAEGEYGAISMATDIYAIGATLYFAVTGRAPKKSLDKVTPLEQYKPQDKPLDADHYHPGDAETAGKAVSTGCGDAACAEEH